MKKKIAIILTLVFILSFFAACSSNAKESKDLEEIGYQYLDTTKPIVKEKGLIEFEIYSSKNAQADNYNDMKVFKDLYDATNVDIKWKNVGESTYEAQKANILSDKSEWSDAIYHAGFSDAEIMRYASRKTILPISDYIDYMPNFKKILEDRPDIKSSLTNPADGKIYSLPRIEEMGLITYPNLLFMNKNWLSSLVAQNKVDFVTQSDIKDGLTLTLDEFKTVLTEFKKNDMNGNDKDDEIPLNYVHNNWQGNQSDLYAAFGISENVDHRTIIDDKVVFTATTDKFKEATQELKSWLSDGLITKRVFEDSQDVFLANGKGTEKYGAFYWWESETVVSNPENYIVLSPLVGRDGTQLVGVANNQEVSKGEFVVMGNCVNPEVLLTYMDRFFDPYVSAQINYGPIGTVYEDELDENNMLVQKDVPAGMTTDELRLKNAPLGVIYLNDYAWDNVVNMEPRAKLRVERLEKYAYPYKAENVKPFPALAYNQQEVDVIVDVETNVYDYVNGKISEWIMGLEVLNDTTWATYKSTLESRIGLSRLINAYQSAYNRHIA